MVHLFLASSHPVLAGEGTVSLFLGYIPLMALIVSRYGGGLYVEQLEDRHHVFQTLWRSFSFAVESANWRNTMLHYVP